MNGLWWKISIKMKNHLNRFRMTTSPKIRYCEKLLTTLDGMFLLDPSTWMILTYSSPSVWYPVKSTTMEWSRRHQIHCSMQLCVMFTAWFLPNGEKLQAQCSHGNLGLRWEYVLCIPMGIVKGNWNGAVSWNDCKTGGPMSVLGQARWRTLWNVYGVGSRTVGSTSSSVRLHV